MQIRGCEGTNGLRSLFLKGVQDAYNMGTGDGQQHRYFLGAGTKADCYRVYWADSAGSTVRYRLMAETKACRYTLEKATHVPHYLRVAAVRNGEETECSDTLRTPVKRCSGEQLERLNRGLVAVKTGNGIFLSWRLFWRK